MRIILLLLIFVTSAIASPSDFISLHQPGGVKKWIPGQTKASVFVRNSNLRNFKFFVPPGTRAIDAYAHIGQGSNLEYNAVIRYGQPPTTSPRFGLMDGVTLNQAASTDYYVSGAGGYMFFIRDYLPPVSGDWVYIQLEIVRGNLIDIQVNIDELNPLVYGAWYNKAVWGADGDPIVGGVAPSPTPVPTFIPTPTINPAPSTDQYIKIEPGKKYIFY